MEDPMVYTETERPTSIFTKPLAIFKGRERIPYMPKAALEIGGVS